MEELKELTSQTAVRVLSLAVLLGLFLGPAAARERRDRAWLLDYVRQSIPDAPRNHRYLAQIEKQLDDSYLGLDLNFLENGGGQRSRQQTNIIGCLAFCYRTKGLRYYQDAQLLEKLRRAYLAAADHIDAEGFIRWPGDGGYYYESHEQGWRLEPLLLGYIWVGEHFPAADRQRIEAALRRAADWQFRNPYTQHNNRGAVWAAVLTLSGLYFEQPDYLTQAELHARHIINGVVLEDGESGEHTLQYGQGGGPDSNYSYTGFAYVYMYRLLSGDSDLDPRLLKAMRWFSLYHTERGFPLVSGASVRNRKVDTTLTDIFPGLERYSHQDPFLATIADHELAKKEKHLPGLGFHIVSPLIWAMLERGVASPTAPPPDWYINHTSIYHRPEVQYALVTRHYQTGVVFRGRLQKGYMWPLRGMQTFALDDEYPILLHGDHNTSATVADGIDTSLTNVSEGPAGWEVIFDKGERIPEWRGDLATITERRGHIWTIYAYTPASAIVIYGGARDGIASRWVMNRKYIPEPRLDASGRVVHFQDRKGRITVLGGKLELLNETNEGEQAAVLKVSVAGPLSATAFSGDGFHFLSQDGDELRFSDRSGKYRLSLGGVLTPDGMLNRQPSKRLMRE